MNNNENLINMKFESPQTEKDALELLTSIVKLFNEQFLSENKVHIAKGENN